MDARQREWVMGPALTAGVILLAEVGRDYLPSPAGVVLLLLALLPVAYAGLSGGFGPGLASAIMVALYTVRFTSVHAPIEVNGTTLQSFGIMMIIAGGMASPMALIRKRERRLRAVVEERARQLEDRNAELSDANAALEAFGYVVSHDLKEPVRAIDNYLDAAREAYGTPQGRSDLEKAAEANARLVRLLQGLLSYSRASSMTPTFRPLSIPEIVRADATRAQYEGLLADKKGELTIDQGIPLVDGDEVILTQLLGNVLLNAVRHSGEKAPRIRVGHIPSENGEVHLVVDDTGPGFPPDVLERFRQLRGARPATLRSGFGLVISQRAAQRLGGAMDLENLEAGARVHLRLPAHRPHDPPRANAGKPGLLAKR